MKTIPSYLRVQTLDNDESELTPVIASSELELKHFYPDAFGIKKNPVTGMWTGCITSEPKEVKKP